MKAWTVPKELDQPLPRPVKISRAFKINMVFVPALFLIIAAIVLSMAYPLVRPEIDLKERGISAGALVTGQHTERLRNSKYAYYIDYRFSVITADGKSSVYQGKDMVDFDLYSSTRIDQTVPIIFDPADPAVSRLNFLDRIRQQDPMKFFYLVIGIVVFPLGLIYLIGTASVLRRYFREKNLLQWARPLRPRSSRITAEPARLINSRMPMAAC
jgi:hypothetical protein